MTRRRSNSNGYPYERLLDEHAFEYAAERLRMTPQQRRVIYGRLALYSRTEIAELMNLSSETVKKHADAARKEAGFRCKGSYAREVLRLMREFCDEATQSG